MGKLSLKILAISLSESYKRLADNISSDELASYGDFFEVKEAIKDIENLTEKYKNRLKEVGLDSYCS